MKNETGTVEVFPTSGNPVVYTSVTECETGDGTLTITEEDGTVTHWSLANIVRAKVTGFVD